MLDRQTERHLKLACKWLDAVLRRQVLRLRTQREHLPEEFRGLCIADSEVDDLLQTAADGDPDAFDLSVEISLAADREATAYSTLRDSRLSRIATRFTLDPFEMRVLLLAVAPDLDLRYQTLFSYVQNDVTRKLATLDLILKLLCGPRAEQWDARRYFTHQSKLFANALLHLTGEGSPGHPVPQLARTVVPTRSLVDFMLGHESLDESLAEFTRVLPPAASAEIDCDARERAVAQAVAVGRAIVLRGPEGSGKLTLARTVCDRLARAVVVCDLRSRPVDNCLPAVLLRRDCMLLGAALYLQLDARVVPGTRLHADLTRTLESAPFAVFLSVEDEKAPAPDIPGLPSLRVSFDWPGPEARCSLWSRALSVSGHVVPAADLERLARELRLTPGEITAVVHEAGPSSAAMPAAALTCRDLRAAARVRSGARLTSLARKVELQFGWDDLILPAGVLQQLREIRSAASLRHVVHSRWGFDAPGGEGISVLFSGSSGTGKTMAAAVLARELDLELYKVDLSCVVSKYVGDTERNLRVVFDEADNLGAILFFDEADALFGKRSEVKDAQDRWANMEVAYLLQKMEAFSGIAVLATNLGRNLDGAFLRRLRHVVEFPFPDVVSRERLWRSMFPAQAPRSGDIEFGFLSKQFELSGGNIRNAVAAAAFLAAEHLEPISMEHLVRAVGREMQKLGKLPSKAEFQGHIDVIARQSRGRS